ncbi:MAG: LysR family transcriptional regulator [Deltaproteobacteria bacterium]|nr:LysR family transcriptional regulator [Deltaproteobacteria bacterium]
MSNISGMLVFSRVVEAGSFTAAAKLLGLSKASVSREISTLEERLGAQLLRRTTRRMSLTEIGEVFYEHCQRVVDEAEAAELSISRLRATPRGVIRLAAPMSFGHLQLAPRLHRFIARYPEVRVELDLTDRAIDLVHERIDLSLRIGRPRNQSYVLRRLCPIRVLVVGANRYLDHAGQPAHPADLLEHNCLGYHGPTEPWAFVGGQRISTSGTFCADNGDALRHAALAGIGLGYLPTFLIGEDVRSGELVPVLNDAVHPGSGLFTVYPESRHLSPKVRAMIDWLLTEFEPEPVWDRGLPVEGRRAGMAYLENA